MRIVLAFGILLTTLFAAQADDNRIHPVCDDNHTPRCWVQRAQPQTYQQPPTEFALPAPVDPAPAPQPQGIGWVFAAYVACAPDGCFVQVPADGLNVRDDNGQPLLALINKTPLIILQQNGNWLYVAAPCTLHSIGVWSSTAPVLLAACGDEQ